MGSTRAAPGRTALRRAGPESRPPAAAGPPPWWRLDPQQRVVALTCLMGAITVAAVAGRLTVPRTLYEVTWFCALVVLFAATEGFVIHVRVRRGAHAVGLGDVPMVLGLLAMDPFLVILARLVGGGGSLVLVRGQRGSKLAFNVALIGVQATVAAWAFRLLGAAPGQPGVREWLASYAATILADVVAVVAVTAVIALHDDPGEWRRLPAAMRSVPLAAVAATVALVSTHAAGGNPWVLVLLAMLLVAVHLAYRAFVQQRQDKAEVEQLYAFTRALNGAAEMDDVLPVLLRQVRDQLRAGVAELVKPDPAGVVRFRHAGEGGMVTVRAPSLDGDDLLEQALRGVPAPGDGRDAMAVPVVIGDSTAALIVADSLPDSGGFTTSRLHLLEALANHAGIALTKVALVERLRQEAAEKEHLALHDSLSGLPNRRHFQNLLSRALREVAAGGAALAVLVVDIDRFAEINDALGHETGDALLVEIATRLDDHVAGRGVVARIGGDEFAVLLPAGPTLAAAAAVTVELMAVIERPIVQGALTLHVRASIGVASAPRHGNEAQALLRHADVAMYAAKRGRTGMQVYDPTVDRNTPQRLARVADLRQAIDHHALLVAFQPKLDLATGIVTGAEALVRWHHALHGSIPPDDFIPLAEHSGLIRPLTMHVLERALLNRADWAGRGHHLHVAVNLSPNSLTDDELPEAVARLLAETATPPAALTLEITESVLMTDPRKASVILDQLHALGVKLSIDDFGTGYSSLDRLRHLPIDEVKIDRSFVQRLTVDHRDRVLVRSATQMGHALDLTVVAEGVEDAETMRYLAAIECDVVQGFHIARPMLADDFTGWLARHKPSAAMALTGALPPA